MRVLFITPSLPWPLDQGARIRAAELIAALPADVVIDLWWIARPDEPAIPDRLSSRCNELRRFERSRPSLLQRIAWPRAAHWFHSNELTAALRRPLPGIDIVHLDEPALLPHWSETSRTSGCLQHHKLESVLAAALALSAQSAGAEFRASKLEAERWRHFEADAVRKLPNQIVCAAEDAQRLRSRFEGFHPVVIENGVDPLEFAPRDAPRDPNRLLFVGSLDYGPNQDGLQAFMRESWPALRAARPNLRLTIVGRGEAPELRAACAFDSRVDWVGHVDDVRPWLANCGALIVPLRIGGGTRIKLTYALSMRTPIVSTATGAEGLAVLDQRHLRLAEPGPAFTAATLGALDSESDDALTAAGRELVIERYSWEHLSRRLAATWRRFAQLDRDQTARHR